MTGSGPSGSRRPVPVAEPRPVAARRSVTASDSSRVYRSNPTAWICPLCSAPILGDVVLQGEDVTTLAVVALGPEMPATRGLDQLRRHPHSFIAAAQTAFIALPRDPAADQDVPSHSRLILDRSFPDSHEGVLRASDHYGVPTDFDLTP